jgi:hypothetical protein
MYVPNNIRKTIEFLGSQQKGNLLGITQNIHGIGYKKQPLRVTHHIGG